MSLTNKTMLAYLKIKLLGMESKDAGLTIKANVHLQTGINAGTYRKCRINRKDIPEIIKAAENARAVHRTLTMPWAQDGWRMLPATMVMEYTNEMRAGKANFKKAIRGTEIKWPAIVKKQEQRLGPLFTYQDYPCVYSASTPGQIYRVDSNPELTKYYTYDYKMQPTPDAGHFILDLEKQTMDEITDKFEKDSRKNMAEAKVELWRRLFIPVKNMAEICNTDKKVYKTLVTNIDAQVKILKDLNVENDTELNDMIDEVKNYLTGFTPGQIRKDRRLKNQLGRKAQSLSDKMTGYMGDTAPK